MFLMSQCSKAYHSILNLRSMTAMRQAGILTAVFLVILLLSAASITWLFYKELSNGIDQELMTKHTNLALQIPTTNLDNPQLLTSPLFLASITLNNQTALGAKVLSSITSSGFENIKLKVHDDKDEWRVYTKVITQGRLSVAINTQERFETLEKVIELFLLVGVITTFTTLFIGLYIGSKNQRRFNAISQALDKLAEGDLSTRIDPHKNKDDLDQVALHIDATANRLEALLKQTRDLSANIAHDLKTPMARLRAKLESALVQDTQHTIEHTLDAALDQTDQMIATFEAILRMAHLSSGQYRERFSVLSLKEIVLETAEIYRAVIEDSGHQFSFNVESNNIIKGDRELIIQLIANLLENALRHTPTNSTISLNCQGLEVIVSDDGPGIKKELRAKVLEPMYRLDKSRHTKGNGLGLSMVDTIAKLHRATLTLTDTHIASANQPRSAVGLSVNITFPSVTTKR